MNFTKLVQVVNYVLAKYDYKLNYTKLIKLLYIADRQFIDKCNFAITGDTYCSMPHGPVLSELYNYINGTGEPLKQGEWNAYFYRDGYDLISRIEKKCAYDEFCKAEIQMLDEVDKKYHDKDYSVLINEVHKFPEWDKTTRQTHSSIPIKKADILKFLGRTDEEIAEIAELENVDMV
jgi:uncharacterized phage-associated protein